MDISVDPKIRLTGEALAQGMEDFAATMREALGEEKPPKKKRSRVITKMAKNVNPGDIMEFPDGWGEVRGWMRYTDAKVVLLEAPGLSAITVPENQRMRVEKSADAG